MINDFSEPCFWGSCVFGLVSGVYAAIIGAGYWIAASVCLCFTGSVGAQRARSLGLSKSIQESGQVLKEENQKLLGNVEELETNVADLEANVTDLRGITKLLDGTEEDLKEVELKLRGVYAGIAGENKKHQNNNLVTLFTLVDHNRDSVLEREEIERLQKFVESVYGHTIDFTSLDTDGDGTLTLDEFIKQFSETQN